MTVYIIDKASGQQQAKKKKKEVLCGTKGKQRICA